MCPRDMEVSPSPLRQLKSVNKGNVVIPNVEGRDIQNHTVRATAIFCHDMGANRIS